jgi:DNA-directed RNA polymerase subunit RPC12/RpoP
MQRDDQIQCQKCGRVVSKARWLAHRRACDKKGLNW